MSYPKNVISIHGAPRSGTTWLAELLSLHPNATLRYQPFFSYEFKNKIDTNSTNDEVLQTLEHIFNTEDPFVLQQGIHRMGQGLKGPEKQTPCLMIMKSVRYHELIKPILKSDQRSKVIGIVRHPGAVINSWLKMPREFEEGWHVPSEWCSGLAKNKRDKSEYWGFERWIELTNTFLQLEKEYPNRFLIVQYERLVDRLATEMIDILEWSGYQASEEILLAASSSQLSENINHNYDVIKSPSVKDRWRNELDSEIKTQIERRLNELNQFKRFNWS